MLSDIWHFIIPFYRNNFIINNNNFLKLLQNKNDYTHILFNIVYNILYYFYFIILGIICHI